MTAAPEALAGRLFERVPVGARYSLLRILEPLRPDAAAAGLVFSSSPTFRVPLTRESSLSPWEAAFVLDDILGCPNYGREEKTAWQYGLTFESIPMALAFQKFGLRAYVEQSVGDDAAAADAVQRMAQTISRAMPLLRKTVLATIADEQVARGNVNVTNHYVRLFKQYTYFRDRSRDLLQKSADADEAGAYDGHFAAGEQAGWHCSAAVQDLFSLLEHLLLIAFLLSGEEAAGGLLASFVGDRWSDKFRRVVDLADPESKRQYDLLRVVHDELRNPAAHGEVRSSGIDFEFLLEGIGPVPSGFVIADGQRSYIWRWLRPAEILDDLDKVERWLADGPLAAAVRYGESGLPLFFGSDIRDNLSAARDDLDLLDDEIDALITMKDRYADMDW